MTRVVKNRIAIILTLAIASLIILTVGFGLFGYYSIAGIFDLIAMAIFITLLILMFVWKDINWDCVNWDGK